MRCGKVKKRLSPVAVEECANPNWLDASQHPLDWNGPTNRVFTEFRDEDLDRPVITHLERVAQRYPDRIAVSDSDTSFSFGQMWAALSGLAENIEAKTKPGDLIGIALPTCSLFPVAILACLAAGRPFVAVDPRYPSDWLRDVLEEAQPALIIARRDGAPPRLWTAAMTAHVIHLSQLPRPARKGWRPAELGLDQPACVLFTSGSTGRPKGIVNSQRGLLQRVAQSINSAHVNEEDRFLTLNSLCTIVGVRDTLTAMLAGASVHLLDPQGSSAREILNIIRIESITILFAFPALLRSLVACAREPAGGALRLVRSGGDATLWSDIDLLRRWLLPGAAIQSIYAATEAPMMQWFVNDPSRMGEPRIPIGYPLPGNRLALIDENGRSASPGEAGELIVASPYVNLGLWVKGGCMAGEVEGNGIGPCRLFRTGDLVRQRPDGLLELVGRKDRRVKIRGARVDLDGVEAILRKHPLVRDVGALARTSSTGEAVTLVAYVSTRDGAPVGTLDELRELMRSAPPAMRPTRLYLTQNIPRLLSWKLDLRSLMALDEITVQSECADAMAPVQGSPGHRDRIGRAVARIWREILQTPVRSSEDDFFEAGGDSLKAITFVMELEHVLGLELPLTVITEAPTFAGLCQVLREQTPTGYIPLVPLKAGAGLPPLFFIHDVGGSVAGLFPVARRMTYAGAVIGIQARGLVGQEPPHATVEAMAEEYLREVKQWQPDGPYYLCGYSFGGLVAFEMARRLSQSGDKVGLVGIFDTMMNTRKWRLYSLLIIARRQMSQFAAVARAAPVHGWPRTAWRIARGAFEELRSYSSPAIDGRSLPSFLKYAPHRILKVGASALIASARYEPGFYDGELTLFAAARRERGLPSLETIWRKHAHTLRIIETAGTHSTMLTGPNADCAASLMTQLLPVTKPAP